MEKKKTLMAVKMGCSRCGGRRGSNRWEGGGQASSDNGGVIECTMETKSEEIEMTTVKTGKGADFLWFFSLIFFFGPWNPFFPAYFLYIPNFYFIFLFFILRKKWVLRNKPELDYNILIGNSWLGVIKNEVFYYYYY